MKVKIGELKAHLSKYLRQLREEGGSIEVCLGEDPVAYHSAAAPGNDLSNTDEAVSSLQKAGLRVLAARRTKDSVELPEPLESGLKDSNNSIVEAIRRERDW